MAGGEIPLLPTWFYLVREGGTPRRSIRGSDASPMNLAVVELKAFRKECDRIGRQRQVGSLAGAAHLLKDNTGVQR